MNNEIKQEEVRYPLPPFTRESAVEKIRKAEDAWNSRDPQRVAGAYSSNSRWRNRSEFINGRKEIEEFLASKWIKEQEYRLVKELWSFNENRIAVRFAYEWKDSEGQWYRSFGNENWKFNGKGLMVERHASINDLPIKESERKLTWEQGRRPDSYPELSDLGL
ncbi:MAG: nuclear transport factor 2 family protein [Pseudohongiellaceae bacterium]|nr:nuclear transport factor 2 family protein [Pseudohongiellaceae bacterium]